MGKGINAVDFYLKFCLLKHMELAEEPVLQVLQLLHHLRNLERIIPLVHFGGGV